MAELPGSFGKYFLCDKIAAGGMAEIYLAKLIGPGGFEKQLVIKQINPALSQERQFVEMFVAEAKTLVSLSHGNIVPVYELGVVDDTYFIAMEYVDGPTLAELLAALERRGERLEPQVAAYVAAELCKGLDYAHRKGEGLIHRDLSPRNALLSREGEVKLVDFGLALASDRARREQQGAGLPAGSFPYMSPEQVRCEPLDQQSDLFSFGVLLWEMLTGAQLFARDDPDATLEAVLSAPISPPSTVHGGVPPELDRVCMRALARRRGERFASAGEVLAALSRFAYSVEPPVTQASVAALIARVSPSLVREAIGDGEGEGDATAVSTGGTGARQDELAHTRPIARPSGRRRAATVRTFATSEGFDDVLANATPLMPFPALRGNTAELLERMARRRGAPAIALEAAAAAAAVSDRPRRAWRWAAGAGVVIAALAAAVAMRGGDAPRAADVRTGDPAAANPGPAHPSAASAPANAPSMAPAPAPAPSQPPAADPQPVVVPASTAAPAPPAGDIAAADRAHRPRGQGTLQVGANPWADVYLDGTLLGQAPGAWPVSAGPHAVELRHRAQRRSFRLAVEPGETEALGLVDFTRAAGD
jgi:serine/threonine protein kinase